MAIHPPASGGRRAVDPTRPVPSSEPEPEPEQLSVPYEVARDLLRNPAGGFYESKIR